MPLKIELDENERLDDLLIDNRKIIQNKLLYSFTSDSVKLANFIKVHANDKVVELCSGSGIIGILICLEQKLKSLTMIEFQEQLANMCKKSLKMNDLEGKVSVICRRLQGVSKEIGTENYDVVFCNPPYERTVIKAASESEVIARSEKFVNIFEICKEAKLLLKFGGKFYCCFPSNRLFELSNALTENGFAIKNVELVFDKNKKARLALVEALKGGKHECVIKEFCKEDRP